MASLRQVLVANVKLYDKVQAAMMHGAQYGGRADWYKVAVVLSANDKRIDGDWIDRITMTGPAPQQAQQFLETLYALNMPAATFACAMHASGMERLADELLAAIPAK